VKTLADLTAATGLPVDLHLMLDLTIPVDDGIQAQGDLIVVPLVELADQVTVRTDAVWVEVPADGVEVVRNEAGGNPHTLVADPGTCLWTTGVADAEDLAVGVIDAMATVYLMHREHGGAGLAPGRYVIRRQREMVPPAPVRSRVDTDEHRDVPRGVQAARAAAAREAQPVWRRVAD
jgi:hypothetical protein